MIPKHYFNRRGVSDLPLIALKMEHIPPAKKQEVCDRYDDLYKNYPQGRQRANEYLRGLSKEFRISGYLEKKV